MKIIKKFFSKKVYFGWFLSYLCILLIVITISSMTYYFSLSITRSEINRTNQFVLNQIRKTIDDELRTSQTIGGQIANDQYLQKCIHESTDVNSVIRSNISKMLGNFASYKLSSKNLEDFFVIFKNADLCVSSYGTFPMDVFYQMNVVRNKLITQESWDYLGNEQNKGEFTILSSADNDGQIESKIAYTLSLPILSSNTPVATALIPINNKVIFDAFEVMGEHAVFIIDENDRILYSLKGSEFVGKVKYNDLTNDGNILYSKGNKSDIVYSYVTSEVCTWKYVVAMSPRVYEEKIIYLKNIALASVLIGGLIGIALLFVFLRKNYKPINDIVRILSKIENNSGENEFDFIENTIRKIMDENLSNSDMLDKQHDTMKYIFISDILKGRFQTPEAIEKGFLTYNITTLSKYYSVVLFYIEDVGDILSNDDERNDIGTWDMLRFIVRNVTEELIGQNHIGFLTEVDDMMCCLININPDNLTDAQNDIIKTVSNVVDFFKHNFHISITATVSEILIGYSGIAMGYKQALEAMDYRLTVGENGVISYGQIEMSIQDSFYQYDIETELKLINRLKSGSYEEVAELVSGIFDQNFKENLITVRMAKLLMHELLSTILKTIQEINNSYNYCFDNEINKIKMLMQSDDILKYNNEILLVLKHICTFISDNKKNHNDKMQEEILDIINERYYDINFSTQSIADELGITANYMLRFFKKQMGIGMVDYLHTVRIMKAKELLKNKNLTVSEIATAVGYCNSNVFIRSFKKSEGITPGEYRGNM